jgi:hypothetical protein
MSRKLPISGSVFAALLLAGALLGQAAHAAPAAPMAALAFSQEQQMGFAALMHRWDPLIVQASRRFDVPEKWIRIVMQVESGGRTMSGEKQPIVSRAGAMGLMQLMPSTYRDMRAEFGLGPDPFAPRDNIFAGAAYLRWLNGKYGYPAMFAAYNDGPGHLEAWLMIAAISAAGDAHGHVARVTAAIEGRGFVVAPPGPPVSPHAPERIAGVDQARTGDSARAAFPDEYAPGVQSVIAFGRIRQGVCEDLAQVKARLHLRSCWYKHHWRRYEIIGKRVHAENRSQKTRKLSWPGAGVTASGLTSGPRARPRANGSSVPPKLGGALRRAMTVFVLPFRVFAGIFCWQI